MLWEKEDSLRRLWDKEDSVVVENHGKEKNSPDDDNFDDDVDDNVDEGPSEDDERLPEPSFGSDRVTRLSSSGRPRKYNAAPPPDDNAVVSSVR